MRNLRPLASAGTQQRLVGRELLHAVVPVGEPDQPLSVIDVEELWPVGLVLEAVDRVDVVEQERQIEHLELLACSWSNFDSDGAISWTSPSSSASISLSSPYSCEFGKTSHLTLPASFFSTSSLNFSARLALGRVLGDHVAELDHDRLLGRSGQRQRDGEGGNAGGGEPLPAR